MKIAIVGCGALGSYYGGKLHQANHQVHFILRSDFDYVKRHGITITSPQGDFKFRPRIALDPTTIGPCDLVIISLKTTANSKIEALVKPLTTDKTMVISLQNGLGNTELLSSFLPIEQVIGGLCFICVNRSAPGMIRHLDHGQITIGEARGWPEPRTHELASSFQNAGIPCKVTDTLRKAQWEKLVWNIPFNGLGVTGRFGFDFFHSRENVLPKQHSAPLSTEALLTDHRWLETVSKLMHEIIEVANELGHPIKHALADRMILNTRSMKDYHPSTVIDFELGRPLEFESMFAIPLAEAATTNISTPIFKRVCQILQHLDDRRPPQHN